MRCAFRHFWTRFICAEDPIEKSIRIRAARIENIKANVLLLEAMRRWDAARQQSSQKDTAVWK
jgi:hypothetical protein